MSMTSPQISVVTTETVAGFRVVRSLGYVEGGGPATSGTSTAIAAMIQQAHATGANAIVAVRWSHGPIGVQESGGHVGSFGLVYGTAVVIEPEAG